MLVIRKIDWFYINKKKIQTPDNNLNSHATDNEFN